MKTPPLSTLVPIDEKMLGEIKSMKPWLRFFSVLGFILAALWLYLACFSAVLLAPKEGAPGLGGIASVAAFLLYGGIAAFGAAASLKLFRAANHAGEIQATPSPQNLAAFLRLKRQFWRIVGVFHIAIISIGLIVTGILIVMELMKKAR
ncbi:MAG: hypothetical protein RL492_1376 [Verrucomicrobiota bacterium]